MRRISAFVLALIAVLVLGGVVTAAPSGGVRVVGLADFNALEARVTALETRPTPTVTVTPSPTQSPTVSPTVTQTPTSTTTPTPSPTATTSVPVGTFPDAASTGPTGSPAATTSGTLTFSTPGAVIENRRHTGSIQINTTGVIIRNSTIVGNIAVGPRGSVTILDTLVDNGRNFNVGAVSGNNITIRRTEIIGGGHSFSCQTGCTIEDNWFHGQADPTSGDTHGDGILFNVASNMIVRHNTLACDMPANGNGACSAGLAMYGDWGPVRDVIVEGNLFKSSPAGYCMYGGEVAGKPYRATNVDVLNNTFERGPSGKCAVYGPVASIAYDAASSWSGNRYADGTPINR